MKRSWTVAELAIAALNLVSSLVIFAKISPSSMLGMILLSVGLLLVLIVAFRCWRIVYSAHRDLPTAVEIKRPVPDELGVLAIICLTFGGPVIALFIFRSSAENHWGWQITVASIALVALSIVAVFAWFTDFIAADRANSYENQNCE